MRTYKHDPFDLYPTWDKVFDDIRSGDVELGETVKVWDAEEGRYVIGITQLYGGQPAVEHVSVGKRGSTSVSTLRAALKNIRVQYEARR